jgi:hypothetical protein
MKGFIYIITNKINGKKYIGRKYFFDKHGKETNWKDYLGSSKSLKQDIKLFGKDNFERQIILTCDTEKELAEMEVQLIEQYNATKDPMFYNISNGTGKIYTTPESVQKGLITRSKWSTEKKHKSKQNLINAFKNMSEETKKLKSEKISKAHKDNESFKKMRSIVQEAVWKNHSEGKKQEILEKRSNSNTMHWSSLTEDEKKRHGSIRKNWHASLTEEQKREHGKKISEAKQAKKLNKHNGNQ